MIKIFYKKEWLQQNRIIDCQSAEINRLKVKISERDKLLEEKDIKIKDLQETIKIKKSDIDSLIEKVKVSENQNKIKDSIYNRQLKKYKEKNKKNVGKIGGLTKENNKLKVKVKDLENKLAESLTDKYRVKKLKPGKTPKMQPAKIKSNAVQSKIIKQVKEM